LKYYVKTFPILQAVLDYLQSTPVVIDVDIADHWS